MFQFCSVVDIFFFSHSNFYWIRFTSWIIFGGSLRRHLIRSTFVHAIAFKCESCGDERAFSFPIEISFRVDRVANFQTLSNILGLSLSRLDLDTLFSRRMLSRCLLRATSNQRCIVLISCIGRSVLQSILIIYDEHVIAKRVRALQRTKSSAISLTANCSIALALFAPIQCMLMCQ